MSKKSVTLLELLIAMVLLGVVVLTFASIENFGRFHTINADRRAKVQNEVSFLLSHIAKRVQSAVGDVNNPPMQALADGFRVRIDTNAIATPGIFTDDLFFNYRLAGNTLNFSCTPVGAGSPACPAGEVLSNRIVSGVRFGAIPTHPTQGFNIFITDSASKLEVALVARYNPASAVSTDNPEVTLKSRFLTYTTAFK